MQRTILTALFAALPAAGLDAQSQTIGAWSPVATTTTPPPRQDARLVHDPVRGRALLAGGILPGQGEQSSEYWEFDGVDWRRLLPVNAINLRSNPTRFVYSPLHQRILALSSDLVAGGSPMRLFAFDGNTFSSLPGSPPLGRSHNFEIAWDSHRQVLVMFGGGVFGSDTWEWDGATWAQRSTGGPAGRRFHEMAYDSTRRRVVLFGGQSLQPTTQLNDTWEWDGHVWRERFGIAPGLRGATCSLAYDSQRGKCVLVGGEDLAGQATNAVWEYDGNSWVRLPTSGGPNTIAGAAVAYDTTNQRLLSVGGYVFGVGSTDLFLAMTIRNAHTATFTAHGTGCAGALGTPTLLPRANSRPLLGAEFQLQFANLPSSPISSVFACLGVDDQTWNGIPLPFDASSLGLPGCSLRLAPAIVVPLSNQGGFADWNLPIPASPVLDGSTFFVQGIVVAPGANAGGALLSDSGRGLLGLL